MIKIELSAKMLRFTIAAIDYRIAAYRDEIASGTCDENTVSDISNDAALLNTISTYLKRSEAEWTKAAPALGDPRARAKLRLIMQSVLTEGFTEAEQDMLMTMGRAASPDPAWTDYLFWPDRFGLDGSVDAALDKVFSYRPITLA